MKLDATAPDGRYEFEFSVTGTDIRVVEAPAEFEILIRRNAGDVKPLLAAILAFDAAQQVEILS
jgi:hypothetical protein